MVYNNKDFFTYSSLTQHYQEIKKLRILLRIKLWVTK